MAAHAGGEAEARGLAQAEDRRGAGRLLPRSQALACRRQTRRRRGPSLPPSRGPSPRLTAEQKRPIPEFLWRGPEAYGQVWTCARIALVIEEEFGDRNTRITLVGC
jgi:hypothetical protein